MSAIGDTELTRDITSSPLYSEDLAPVPDRKRTWNTWNYAALWISMSLCIPTYMLASSLIEGGMNWWQSILTIFLGNLVVLIPMVLKQDCTEKCTFQMIRTFTKNFILRQAILVLKPFKLKKEKLAL